MPERRPGEESYLHWEELSGWRPQPAHRPGWSSKIAEEVQREQSEAKSELSMAVGEGWRGQGCSKACRDSQLEFPH